MGDYDCFIDYYCYRALIMVSIIQALCVRLVRVGSIIVFGMIHLCMFVN